jgi:hypothetical protein
MGVTVINTTFNNIPNVALGCIGVWSIRRKSLTNYITPQTDLSTLVVMATNCFCGCTLH